jgi:hypothetical protein
MGLADDVISGQVLAPPRIVVSGTEKIGKTTFAAGAPRPIFVQTEEGADQVGCARFPLSKTLDDVSRRLKSLRDEEHDYETLVIDSLDWLERLVHARVAADRGVPSIESIGYGKGYIDATALWAKILDTLDEIRQQRSMAIVLIAHVEVKRFDDPSTESYDRYQLKMHKGASALVTEWCDALLFACQDTRVKKEDVGFNAEKKKGITSGKRVLRTVGAPAWVAGNRYGLPETIDLSWAAFEDALTATTAKKAAE